MPPSIARIALYDAIQHTQQGQDPHTDEEMQDQDQHDVEVQEVSEEREIQSARIGDSKPQLLYKNHLIIH
jgi:hypothetical protein